LFPEKHLKEIVQVVAQAAPRPYNIDYDPLQESEDPSRMYPEIMLIPMREELTRAGIEEARTAEAVDAAVSKPGTTMVVVNSVCGCAAGKMRPGVRLALKNAVTPDRSITVFAGQDREATDRARACFEGNPPTSPAVAILRDGKLVYLMQRFVIENSTPQVIAEELSRAFNELCAQAV
jgi:putative YphP/YqiW family bacilliredoxin